MVQQVLINDDDYYVPDANQLITEDDTLDNFATSKQKRLLIGSLYSTLQQQTFFAAANVGVYHTDGQTAIVPDVFLSFDVQVPENWLEQVGLGVTLWEGKFEEREDTWLRWCYQDGTVLLTGDERAEQAEQRAQQAEQRTQLLADRLRAMGIDPDTL